MFGNESIEFSSLGTLPRTDGAKLPVEITDFGQMPLCVGESGEFGLHDWAGSIANRYAVRCFHPKPDKPVYPLRDKGFRPFSPAAFHLAPASR